MLQLYVDEKQVLDEKKSIISGLSLVCLNLILTCYHSLESLPTGHCAFSAPVLQGTLKGLTGIICDATAKEVLMELHSQFKKVHVLRMNVGLLDRSGNLINDGRTGAGTPRPTPMREPRTPMVCCLLILLSPLCLKTRLHLCFCVSLNFIYNDFYYAYSCANKLSSFNHGKVNK